MIIRNYETRLFLLLFLLLLGFFLSLLLSLLQVTLLLVDEQLNDILVAQFMV
jgi:hypothetical protein